MKRFSQYVRTLSLMMLLSAAVSFSGCGRKESSPLSEGGENSPATPGAKPAEAPLDLQTEQKLDPLTTDDVELYLKVMRAAAQRVKNPTSADKAAIEGASRILAGSGSGRVPTQGDVKTLATANLVALAMDQIVADEMKIDAKTYRGIAEAVESAVPNPALAVTSTKEMPAAPDHAPTPLQERLSSAKTVNEKFLAPNREEIQKLILVVRNPLNLPK
ncbi:MAG: hypothetical protein JWN92_2085 [Candidatus Acidoferrum typicum]|nr:hypothetical protein [Candidatus Acidoferrum typicum]